MKTFDELKQLNIDISKKIGNAEQYQDHDLAITLKKELYTNKLTMLELITQKNKKNNIQAGQLRDKIAMMKPAIRYETGLHYLDQHLNGGFEVGSFIILGGQSGAGKSHILLDMLANISRFNRCVFFNFEMGDRRIITRLKRLLHEPVQWDNLLINSESRDLDDLMMDISLLAEDGVKFFAIDSKMKIIVKGSEAEHQKISKISKSLSELAIKNDIIIFLVNQISEENLKNNRLSFKGSGDQIYDADMALFLTIEDEGVRRLTCVKNRQDEFLFNDVLPNINNHNLTPVHEVSYEMAVV